MSSGANDSSRRLDVLILNWKDIRNPDAGGSEVVLHELATRLARRHCVTWFCRAFAGCAREEILDGFRVVRRGGLLTTYLHAPRFYRSLRPRPDVVLDVVNTLAWQSPLYAGRHSIAYVHQAAADVLLYHLPWPLSRLAFALEQYQFLPYRKRPTIAVSESTKRDLLRFGFRESTVRVVESGVDHELYRPDPERRSAHPSFLFVGRLAPMKRVDLCVRALADVSAELPEATLTVVGSGSQRASLQALAAELGVGERVEVRSGDTLLDPQAEVRKVNAMQEAWAILLPSVKEGWGLVVLEAAACGTPAIVTDVSGLRDAVRAGQTGLVLSADPSADELATAMLRLARDEDLRERLGKGAFARARALDWERTVEQVESELFAAS